MWRGFVGGLSGLGGRGGLGDEDVELSHFTSRYR